MLFYLPLLQFMQLIGGEIVVIAILMGKIKYLYTVIVNRDKKAIKKCYKRVPDPLLKQTTKYLLYNNY